MCRRAGAKESGSGRGREAGRRQDRRETWGEDREIEGRERKLGGE